jgi:hypothetical protein
MIYTEQIKAFVSAYFRFTPDVRKYNSTENLGKIVTKMETYGLPPSDTGVVRAIAELVGEGVIDRVDGGTPESDAEAARIGEQQRLNQIAATPLTERDFDSFIRMTPSQLETKYYGDAEFRARYTNAVRDWGFRVPPKPKGAIA